MAEQHEIFDVFCRTRYGTSNENTQGGCSESKTITAAKERKIVTLSKKTNIDCIGALHLESPKNRMRITRLSNVASRFWDSIVTSQKALRHLGIPRKRCAF